ncbi:MAG: hypothetical protein JWO77_1208 [Ilumatobacteraceae bacterium]|nr:hypothetical protein [Ilumatobacteraceae bacterium]
MDPAAEGPHSPTSEPETGPAPDPDDADASSGACGCILAAIGLILIVGVLYACAARGPGGSTCAAAWDDAARSGTAVRADAYKATLGTCSTVEEWDEQNIAHGARLAPGAATIAELCRSLDVTSTLCTTAQRATP